MVIIQNPMRSCGGWDYAARKRHTQRLRRRKRRHRVLHQRSVYGFPSSKRKQTPTRSSCASQRTAEKRRKLREAVVSFEGHNVHGLQSDGKREELIERMFRQQTSVYAMQETWIVGDHDDTYNGYRLLLHGGKPSDCGGRNKGGVGIMLAPDAVKAFVDGGCVVKYYGDRLMAVTLAWIDGRGRKVTKVVASGYAPTSAASPIERTAFLDSLGTCETDYNDDCELYISIDGNASMGVKRDALDRTLGPYGIDFVNESGLDLHSTLATHEMCAVATFFEKKSYGTWFSIRNGKPYQIDHWLVRRRDLRRVTDCGLAAPSIASDHPRPLRLRSRIVRRLAVQRPREQRFIDRASLQNPATEKLFVRKTAAMFTDMNDDIMISEKLSNAMADAAQQILHKLDRRRPDWFQHDRVNIMCKAIHRNTAVEQLMGTRSALLNFVHSDTPASQQRRNVLRRNLREAKAHLKRARHQVKRAVNAAKEAAFLRVAKDVNKRGNALVWPSVQAIKGGIHKLWKPAPRMLKKTDGSGKCKTDRENKQELATHFEKVLNIDFGFDPSVLDEIEQRPIWDGSVPDHENLDCPPDRAEIRRITQMLASGKATGDSTVFAELLKSCVRLAMAEEKEGTPMEGTRIENALLQCVTVFWRTGICDTAWLSLRLKAMPKKHPADEANKFRGIYLTDIIAKLFHKMFERRLAKILDKYGLEEQCGFMNGRGTVDGTFALRQCVLKAREYQVPVWAAMLDLVKAFPSNSRDAMWGCLAKFGVPPTLLARIKDLHTGMVAKFKSSPTNDIELPNSSGCIQGSALASPTFLIVLQCALEVTQRTGIIKGINFFTPTDGKMSTKGRGIMGANWRLKRDREQLTFWVSLYADDAAQVELSRPRLQASLNVTVNTLARFGLKVHLASSADGVSKTECMVFLPSGIPYDSVDTSPLKLDKGWTSFTRSFTYLGTLLTTDACDDKAIDARIVKAGAVFGALRRGLFGNSRISFRVKAIVWQSLIGSVLLYGSETWCLTCTARAKLVRFQRRCIRAMCGVSLRQTRHRRITTKSLAQIVGVPSVLTLYARKALAWLGHLARMHNSRLCKRMAFAWMERPRKQGGQLLNWGHTMLHNHGEGGLIKRAANSNQTNNATSIRRKLGLVSRNQHTNRNWYKDWRLEWYKVAQDREDWTDIVNAVDFEI